MTVVLFPKVGVKKSYGLLQRKRSREKVLIGEKV
jgi:hypothetical protein